MIPLRDPTKAAEKISRAAFDRPSGGPRAYCGGMAGRRDNGSSLGLVDWQLASATAHRLLRSGPPVTRSEADSAVTALRSYATQATRHVGEITGLPVSGSLDVSVTDRGGWVDANVMGLTALLDPLAAALESKRSAPPGYITAAIGRRVVGVQAGAVLAFLSHRVLGQYEIFSPTAGNLILVAPNIVDAERSLGVVPADFRLWVCVHEVTHQVQFTSVPWLRSHLHDQVAKLVTSLELGSGDIREHLSSLGRNDSGANGITRPEEADSVGLLGIMSSPDQRATLGRLTALMSLLEGHAEHVMNAVDREAIPSLPQIQRQFARRRRESGLLEKLIRHVFGLNAKMRQYTQGRAFVQKVIDAVGMQGLNAIWASPETLPSSQEIADPQRWVRRVHGPVVPSS